MQVGERRIGATIVLSPAPRMEIATADAFKDRLLAAVKAAGEAGGHVIVDMAALEYISSAGLRALMIGHKAAKAQGNTAIGIADMQPVVAEIFRISRFDLVLRCFPSVDEAVAGLAGA